MKYLGCNPPKRGYKRAVYIIFAIFHILCISIVLNALDWLEFVRVFRYNDMKLIMLRATMVLFSLVMGQRILLFACTFKKYQIIKDAVKRSSFNFECFGINNINVDSVSNGSCRKEKLSFSSIWTGAKLSFSESNELESFRLKSMVEMGARCSAILNAEIALCVILSIFWNYKETHGELFEDYNPYLNKTSLYRKTQLRFYMPFDSSLEGHDALATCVTLYTRFGILLLFLPIDSVLPSILAFLIAQTRIVQEAFKYVDKNISPSQSPRNVFLIKEIRIVKCINELQEIYRILDMLQNLYSFQTLLQCGLGTFLLCTLGYIAPMVSDGSELFCFGTFLIAVTEEIFILSYVSNTLTIELQNVAIDLYNIEWDSYPIRVKKLIEFTLRRIQKPASLTACKLFNIDLAVFIQMLQTAYSFYTVISSTSEKLVA
ncbi:unnamed protein product [Phyllotreta striolata]|uniref:Odorant receptor n=1 Tax=Phyllotreta striolata TaxID=444603 RepID=A0A9N9TDI9_PHYSR|nr:unnamed protein product [Phyllotreta striolata]